MLYFEPSSILWYNQSTYRHDCHRIQLTYSNHDFHVDLLGRAALPGLRRGGGAARAGGAGAAAAASLAAAMRISRSILARSEERLRYSFASCTKAEEPRLT